MAYFYGVTPPARWPRPYPMNARRSSPLVLRAAPLNGPEGLEPMTRTEDEQAARRRGESVLAIAEESSFSVGP